ncbi:MAG: c-type cytochrome [Anaerolineae bacterium]
MKLRTVLQCATVLAITLLALLGCVASEQPPVVIATTPIPSLIPATLPPQPIATLMPAAVQVTFPSRRPSTKAAASQYQERCITCHGPEGQGVVPGARNFSDVDYLRGQSPLRLYEIISDGRGSMPGWADVLSVNERWDLAFYVWNFAASLLVLQRGEAIYQRNCATCHNADGTGSVPGTPDFTQVEWMAGYAPRDFFKVLTEGQGSMPSWQGKLSPEERWASIEFIRSLAYEETAVTASR